MTNSLSDQLKKFADDLEERLREQIELANGSNREQAAKRLTAKIRRIAKHTPEAPEDAASQEAVNHVLQMLRTIFPSWTLRGPGGGT